MGRCLRTKFLLRLRSFSNLRLNSSQQRMSFLLLRAELQRRTVTLHRSITPSRLKAPVGYPGGPLHSSWRHPRSRRMCLNPSRQSRNPDSILAPYDLEYPSQHRASFERVFCTGMADSLKQNLGHSGAWNVGSVHDPRAYQSGSPLARQSLFARQAPAILPPAQQGLFSASVSQGKSPTASWPPG